MPRLRPYQRIGVRRVAKFGYRALIGDEPGLGKTAQALWVYKAFIKAGKVLVVCPKTIKPTWQHEALKHVGLRAEIIGGKTPPKTLPEAPIYIINYDVLWDWADFLSKQKFEYLVTDESHRLKTPTAKCTKAAKLLSRVIPKMVALSGTPITNRPIEFWPVLNMLRPKEWPSFARFGDRYCAPEYTPWGKKYNGAERMDELHRILTSTVMIRRRKKDVLTDLPPKQWIPVPIELNDHRQYMKAERDIIDWLRQTRPERASKARKAERLAKLIYLRQLVGELKIPTMKEWIGDFLEESDGKLITFGNHIDFLGKLTEHYGDLAVKITGSVTGKKRQLAFDRFLNTKECRLLFGNIRAAGEGWSAPGVGSVLFGEFPWTPAELDQCADRIHGIGRGVEGRQSMIYMMAAVNTIDQFMCDLLTKKRKVLGQALDGDTAPAEAKMFDALENYLLDKGKK